MRVRRALGLALSGALAAACSATGATTPPAPAPAPADPLALVGISDLDPSPTVVEFALTAREADKDLGGAKLSRAWTYNGAMPGPLVDAKVGDELVIHFKNELPEPTMIHWHGIRLPIAMDGSPSSQKPVPPGGTFEYRFKLRDAGLFWFHPHVRTDVQIERGLVGVIRVAPADPKEEPSVDEERVLVLDDVRVNADGSFPTYLDDNSKMMGREGNTVLVNGVRDARIALRPGAIERLRILNAANGRFFNLKIPGVRFRVIGTDGGLVESPYDVDTLLIAPAERYDVVFQVPSAPGTLPLTSQPYERGHHTGELPPLPVATLAIAGEPPSVKRALPERGPVVAKLPAPMGEAIPFALDEGTNAAGDLIFTLNGQVWPAVAAARMALNETRVLEITNKSEMDHPFHVHGAFFQVLTRNGTPEPANRLANKDTIIVPAKSTLRVATRFDEIGAWMVHCHIEEHAEGGMMGEILVGDAVSHAH